MSVAYQVSSAVESNCNRQTKPRLEQRHIIIQKVGVLDRFDVHFADHSRELLPDTQPHHVTDIHVVVFELLRLLQHATSRIGALATFVLVACTATNV